jgi:hypothetical protein
MASATRPRIQAAGSLKTAIKVAQSGDSREKLLKDVMREINAGLENMSPLDRKRAVTGIHSIAENVRKRQVKSAGR